MKEDNILLMGNAKLYEWISSLSSEEKVPRLPLKFTQFCELLS